MSTNTIKTFLCESFSDYISWSLDLCSKHHFVIFRGVKSDLFPLIPGIARTVKSKWNRTKSIQVNEIENQMFEEFLTINNREIKAMDIKEKDQLEVLCLAQHYGLPTRLLDWTSNPLAALWFACDAISDKDDLNTNISIWACCMKENDRRIIDPRNQMEVREKPFDVNRTYIFKPLNVTDRIHLQAGWFTLHDRDPRQGFVPLEKNNEYRPDLCRVLIKKELVENLLDKLDILHVNSSVLFPGISGACNHLRYKVLSRYKEFE
ncbi:MAG: FRG domain-containing protein [Bacteroidota bacterium]